MIAKWTRQDLGFKVTVILRRRTSEQTTILMTQYSVYLKHAQKGFV